MQPTALDLLPDSYGTSDATELRALYTLTDRLFRASSIDEAYEAALDAITGSLGCRRASILRFDEAGVMRFVAWRGLSEHYRRALAGHSPWTPGTRDAEPILVPDILDSDEPDWIKSTIAAEGIRALGFVPIVARGGVVGKFMVYRAQPHAFPEREVELATAIARQVGFSIERAQAEDDLRESEARFRLLAEHAPVMIWMGDEDGDCLHLNRELRAFWGLPADPDGASGFDWRGMVHPDDRARLDEVLGAAMRAHAPVRLEVRMRDGRGEYRRIETGARPRFSASGAFLGMIGVNTDVTERKEAEAQRELLLAELNHRVKNTLAVVQALAHQTFREPVLADVRRTFEGRLAALAAANDLLTRDAWDSAPLDRLAANVLGVNGEGEEEDDRRVTLAGPRVLLPPKQAVAVTLALHELFTNALKYGALSSASGRVAVEWRDDAEGGLRITWTEAGGPPVEPPARKGFGSVLIERALAHDCEAKVATHYHRTGLACVIELPTAG